METEPWTIVLQLAWRPSLDFFDHKIDFLRELDREKRLKAFRVTEGSAEAQLSDHVELELTVRGLDIWSGTGAIDAKLLDSALAGAQSVLRPELTRLRTYMTHLVDLGLQDQADDQAQAVFETATKHVWGDVVQESGATDFAMLLDGRVGEALSWQAEFGVVTGQEGWARLHRSHSRIGERGRGMVELGNRGLPSFALFVDSRWERTEMPGSDHVVHAGHEFVRTSRDEASKLVSLLYARVKSAF